MQKILFILHYPPPLHGAARVGEIILNSKRIQKTFDTSFIKLQSSDELEDIGKFNLKKVLVFVRLYFEILFTLISFKPEKIYYTASPNGFPFYRDLIIAVLLKIYTSVSKGSIFYHYHSKGSKEFIDKSAFNLKLFKFFLKDSHLILLSPILEKDFSKVLEVCNSISFLENASENPLSETEYTNVITNRYKNTEKFQMLFLSNMVKEKGYWYVLLLAKYAKDKNYTHVEFNFAGPWRNNNDKVDFFDFVEKNQLHDIVVHHGKVVGEKKKELLGQTHLMIFPTRFHKEAFAMVVIEAFSYGIPVLSSDQAAIPDMVTDDCGIVVDDLNKLSYHFEEALNGFINIKTSHVCRKRYLENYTIDTFESKLVLILKNS